MAKKSKTRIVSRAQSIKTKPKVKPRSKPSPARSKPKPKARPVVRVVRKSATPKKPAPYLTSKGTVSRKAGLNKWLTKTGKLDKRKKLPKGVRGLNSLYAFQQKKVAEKQKRASARKQVRKPAPVSRRAAGKTKGKVEKERKPWLNKDGSVNQTMEISKYLTANGKLDKRIKLPEGVKTIEQLYDYLRSKKVTEKSKWVNCQDLTMFAYKFRAYVDQYFDSFKKVHMAGKKVSWATWNSYGDDYVNKITNFEDSPPSVNYTICSDKLYKYLFF